MAVTFGLMRHAPTRWNLEKRIQGQADSPLTSEGVTLARRWGARLASLAWDRILTSDLGRALATTSEIGKTLDLPVVPEPRLREQDWGRWTGLTLSHITTHSAAQLQQMQAMGWAFRPPDGESRSDVWLRARQAILDAGRRWPTEKLLVITHEGVLKCILYKLSGRQFLSSERPWKVGAHLHLIGVMHAIMGIDTIAVLPLERRLHP